MANRENQTNENNEDREFEKELNRLKLSAERGTRFPEEKKISEIDETEDDFVKRMKEMEDALRNPDSRKIIEILGFPDFPKVEDLRDDELEAAIDLVTMALANENIALDVIHPTPLREIYRFLTEELLFEEGGMAGAGGMTWHFIYEEFHRNFEEDIKTDIADILSFICRGDKTLLPYRIAQKVRLHGEMVSREKFQALMEDHRHVFEGMRFVGVDSMTIDIQGEKAEAEAEFRYELDESSGTPGEFSTKAKFHFELADGTYDLNHLIIDTLGIK